MNLRPSGYEPDELPGCSIPHQGLYDGFRDTAVQGIVDVRLVTVEVKHTGAEPTAIGPEFPNHLSGFTIPHTDHAIGKWFLLAIGDALPTYWPATNKELGADG